MKGIINISAESSWVKDFCPAHGFDTVGLLFVRMKSSMALPVPNDSVASYR
jgi:hypothetical protein